MALATALIVGLSMHGCESALAAESVRAQGRVQGRVQGWVFERHLFLVGALVAGVGKAIALLLAVGLSFRILVSLLS